MEVAPTEQQETDQPLETAALGLCLRFSPAHLEREFWSNDASRLLRALDIIGLSYATVSASLIFWKFRWLTGNPGMLWHFFLCILYVAMALLQLGLLLAAPSWYKRKRHAITVANRLMRLAGVTVVVLQMSNPSIVKHVTSTLGDEHLAELSSGLHGAAGAAGNACAASSSGISWPAGSGSNDAISSSSSSSKGAAASLGGVPLGPLLALLRPMAGPPLAWMNHSINFVVPFHIVLPMQLYTAAVSMVAVRSVVCNLAVQDAYVRTAVQTCLALRRAMQAAVQVLGLPPESPVRECTGCEGVGALLWMVLFTYSFMLFVVPCLGIYLVELSLKLGFAESRQMRVQQKWLGDTWVRALVALTVVCAVGLVCDSVVQSVTPVTCRDGLLVMMER